MCCPGSARTSGCSRTRPTPPLAAYLASLKRTAGYDSAEALPAHEYRFHGLADRARMLLAHHDRRCAEVLAVTDRLGPATVWQITQELSWSRGWGAVTGMMRRAALAETAAHLEYLSGTGRIDGSVDGPGPPGGAAGGPGLVDGPGPPGGAAGGPGLVDGRPPRPATGGAAGGAPARSTTCARPVCQPRRRRQAQAGNPESAHKSSAAPTAPGWRDSRQPGTGRGSVKRTENKAQTALPASVGVVQPQLSLSALMTCSPRPLSAR